jgi:hypothetical protein
MEVGEPEKNKPLRRRRGTFEGNIKTDLKELCCGLFSTGLRQFPVAGSYDGDEN